MVVTAHKAGLYEETAAELDELDELAVLCREVSVVRRDGDRLVGVADRAEIGRAGARRHRLAVPLGGDRRRAAPFRRRGHGDGFARAPLCAGRSGRAGGLVDVRPERAASLRDSLALWRPGLKVRTRSPEEAVAVLRGLPPGSLIVNATGLGKDGPGSPVPLPAVWPAGAVVWDLNYRGELTFLEDARRAGLEAHDGWRLFLHGWSEALGCLLDRRLSDPELAALEQAALAARGP